MSTKIPGRLMDDDCGRLSAIVSGKNVLMLGCHCGRALVIVAKYAWATWVVDDLLCSEGVAGELQANADRYLPADAEVNLIHDRDGLWVFPEGARDLPADGVEVVYRDADRREESRQADDMVAQTFLQQRGGTYAWHDDEHNLRWLEVKATPLEVN